MNILVNTAAEKSTGPIQVSDSVCRELIKYPQHNFVIVIGEEVNKANHTYDDLKKICTPNIKLVCYQIPKTIHTLLTGRNAFMDNLVEENNIDGVITMYAPSYWVPKVKNHVTGFALPFLIFSDGPYKKALSFSFKMRLFFDVPIRRYFVRRCANKFFTEGEGISVIAKKMFPEKSIKTITGNSNQVFFRQNDWDCSVDFPRFDGFTMLTVATNIPYKNLPIILPTIDYLNNKYPSFKFRFVLTLKNNELGNLTPLQESHIVFIGRISIQQCPHLYEQSDCMLHPSLLESFSASYSDAMVMKTPILTTDLGFAHDTCGDAALYYSPLDYKDLGDKIYQLANDRKLQQTLVDNGVKQQQTFDTPEDRAKKLIDFLMDTPN